MQINIKETAKEVLLAHLESTFPNEGCGFLYGTDDDIREVTLAVPIRNVKEGDQRRRFEIHPLDYIKAERYALEHDLNLLGIFHSHPNHPAIPSEHDRRQAVPFFSYVIASVYEGKRKDLTSWRLDENNQQFISEVVIRD